MVSFLIFVYTDKDLDHISIIPGPPKHIPEIGTPTSKFA